MRSSRNTQLHSLAALLVVLALLFLPAAVLAQETATAQLDPVGDSGISGTATLTAAGDGTTVALDVQGLAAGAAATATLHSGTCALPSASFVGLPNLQADAGGRATATGSVLFQGTENVALATLADGEHVIVVQTDRVVACGVIPRLASVAAPPTLPVSGGAAFPFLPALVVILGLCAFCAGLFLTKDRVGGRS